MNPKRLLASAMALLLNACGPGIGGSGVTTNAEDYLALAGAKAAPVCSAAWATQLACEPPIGSSTVAPSHPGTSKVQYASSSSSNPDFVLSFEGNKVSLEGGCPRIPYSAEWGQVGSSGAAAFFGGYLDAGLIQPVLVMGTVQALAPSSDGGTPRLQLELRSASGQVLALLQLQRLTGSQASPRSCP